jgi:hypothetical protein
MLYLNKTGMYSCQRDKQCRCDPYPTKTEVIAMLALVLSSATALVLLYPLFT